MSGRIIELLLLLLLQTHIYLKEKITNQNNFFQAGHLTLSS